MREERKAGWQVTPLPKWFPFTTRTLCDSISVKLEHFMLACMATVFLTNYLLALSIPRPCQKCPPPLPPSPPPPKGCQTLKDYDCMSLGIFVWNEVLRMNIFG